MAITSGTTEAGRPAALESDRVLYVRYAAGFRGTRIGGSPVVMSPAELDAATGTVNSVQNVLVRFLEVDVAQEEESTTTEVVQFGGTALTQEVRGMWFNCCCTSGRLSR